MAHCLDSWAILAWLDGAEPAATLVDELVDGGRPVVSWINLVEVEYRLRRDQGEAEADTTLGEIRQLIDEDLPGIVRMREVAGLKAQHPIALADCFAIATASAFGAGLVTGDPEIVDRAEALDCAVIDARRPDAG